MGEVRIEVMWCVDCGARFTQEEINGWGCPKCGSQGVPCAVEKDTTVEVNWHELHILSVWAENWAQNCVRNYTDKRDKWMLITAAAIARRLQAQHPELGHLSLSGEIASLPTDLAKAGIEVGAIETHNIDKPKLLPVNGPGAVGHVAAVNSHATLTAALSEARGKVGEAERERDEAKNNILAWSDAHADMEASRDAALSELAKLRGEAEWRPIETMPKGEELFMAATAGGRLLIVRGSMLAIMMKRSTPDHLQFPAVAWKPLPSPPKDPGK